MISKIMTKKLIINKKTDSINEVALNMMNNNIGFIPISDNNKIIGVITDRDIVTRIISNNIDINGEIEDYITKEIISIDEDESLDKAIELIKKHKIKRLLITNNNKLSGIISLADIINSDTSPHLITELLKSIFEFGESLPQENVEIDEFYL